MRATTETHGNGLTLIEIDNLKKINERNKKAAEELYKLVEVCVSDYIKTSEQNMLTMSTELTKIMQILEGKNNE